MQALLLCDEPTGALDTKTADQVMDLLFEQSPPETTIVIVTHDARIAARCDETIYMVDGQMQKGVEYL